MARDDPHFRLRLPAPLRDRLAAAAKANNRSANAEVVARLERSFVEMPKGIEDVRERHDEVLAMMREVLETAERLAAVQKSINDPP